jgi:GMP synthase-like glutamine amidotransferase
MRVLIVDNTIDPDSWGSPDLARSCARVPGVTISVRRAPQEDLPRDLRGFDRVVLSGSKTSCFEEAPWVTRLEALVREAMSEKKPLLGVCYGHQTIARMLGGKAVLGRSARPEVGWTGLSKIAPSRLTEGLPDRFHSFSRHFEEVSSLPKGLKHTLRSERCENQAFEMEGAPVFGIQFHPERSLEEAEKTLAERRKLGEPKELLGYGKGPELFDPAVGDTIFRNFLSL